MLDFGWAELLIIVAVAVFVIGPKDIPNLMYGFGRVMRRLQYVRYAVTKQFDDIMNVGDLQELQKGVNFESKNYSADNNKDTDSEIDSEAEADLDYGTEPTDDIASQLNDLDIGEVDDQSK